LSQSTRLTNRQTDGRTDRQNSHRKTASAFHAELVVTAACTMVKMKKPLQVYLHIFTNISQQSVQHHFIRCS